MNMLADSGAPKRMTMSQTERRNPLTNFFERRREKKAEQLREIMKTEITDRTSMTHQMFSVFVNAEVDRRLRDILRGRRIAHCYVCLASDQLFKVGTGAMACRLHAVVKERSVADQR